MTVQRVAVQVAVFASCAAIAIAMGMLLEPSALVSPGRSGRGMLERIDLAVVWLAVTMGAAAARDGLAGPRPRRARFFARYRVPSPRLRAALSPRYAMALVSVGALTSHLREASLAAIGLGVMTLVFAVRE